MNQVVNDDKRIDEASKDSFPASDPPAWTTGIEQRQSINDKKRAEEKSKNNKINSKHLGDKLNPITGS